MVICGLKLTHDGSVAIVEDGKLVFNIELEKIGNNPRYTSIEDTAQISTILGENGYTLDQVTHFAVDGWGGFNQEALAIQPRLTIGDAYNALSAENNEQTYSLSVAQYQERTLKHSILERWQFDGLRINGRNFKYDSYLHVTGHVLSTYCTSPFAARGEGAYILVWDGGMYPRLYFFNPQTRQVENLGPIFLLIGNVYTIFSQHFGPFKVKGSFAKDELSVAGKVMAYIALGKERRELFDCFDQIYNQHYTNPMGFANAFANEFKKEIENKGYSDEDILCSFHVYLEELLIKKLEKKISRYDRLSNNLCLSGGCALNIKWNSAIRSSGLFREVYVPPFPNDSGSAIGAACGTLLHETGAYCLDWNVYSGPAIIRNAPAEGWSQRHCPVADLARLLHTRNEPVVLLNGKAELGPRALGNRSIVAAATSPRMKNILNGVKKREAYRPVSPICLSDRAREIFEPGTSDPYMLFDHRVKQDWLDKIPAVCHLDGTARLQTIAPADNPLLADLLLAYEAESNIPVLCNTSANFNGSGFFPDVYSATRWNEVNYVWCDEYLYERDVKLSL